MQKFLTSLNTGILVLTALGNSIIVQAFSTINKQVTEYLPDVSSAQVSFTALVFMIFHPIISVPVNYVLDRYPLKLGISINCVLVCIGVALRLLVLQGFAWVIAGNVLCAIGNTFILNCPAKYSALWYPPQKRLLITSLIIFANCISGAVGAFVSPMIVKANLPIEQGQQKIQELIIIHAISICSIMILNLIFFRGSPNSYCQKITTKTQQEHQPYIVTLKNLFRTKQFLFPFLCMVTFLSVLNSITTNIELFIVPFGFTSKQAGVASLLAVVSGLLSSVVMSILISRTRKYKKIIQSLYILSIVALLCIGMSILVENIVLYYISVSFFGFAAFPTISALIQYSCESLYPTGQATVTGILLAGGQVASFFVGLAEAIILGAKTKQNCFYSQFMNLGLLIICSIIFSLTKQKLLRLQSHQKKAESFLSQPDSLIQSGPLDSE